MPINQKPAHIDARRHDVEIFTYNESFGWCLEKWRRANGLNLCRMESAKPGLEQRNGDSIDAWRAIGIYRR
jgi:hypothetical protein